MAFDYKKEYKEFYMLKQKPSIVEIPKMNYIAVRGKGNPNDKNSEYKNSIGLLYAIAFTIKMSYKGSHKIDGYFEYVVPPLEGFWWQENTHGIDYNRKEDMNFISVIRLPDFVTEDDFRWAVDEATAKKKQDFSKVEFLTYDEGVCVQCMHIGSYDNEPETVDLMHKYMEENGYELDITDRRLHHEIYLSDPRRCDESKLKTVIRHPIKRRKRRLHMSNIIKFENRKEFRNWLCDNCQSTNGVWLLFGKSKGPKTIKANEALEEALCFGWIDGQMQSIDDKTYKKYFSMRRKNSKWSEKNKALVKSLEEQGLMTDFGREKIQEAKNNGQWDAPKPAAITDEQIACLSHLLEEYEPAFSNFQNMSLSVRKTYTRAYFDAKTDVGREKRIVWMVDRLNKNLKPM